MLKSDWVAVAAISASVVITLAVTAWLFLVQQEYRLVIEAACDPASQACFARDCSNEDDCPPNGLEVYTVYRVAAQDFQTCADESCALECASGAISCEEQVCNEAGGDECATIPEPLLETTDEETGEEKSAEEE